MRQVPPERSCRCASRLWLRRGQPSATSRAVLQFLCGISSSMQGGFFLRKEPLTDIASLYANWRTAIARCTPSLKTVLCQSKIENGIAPLQRRVCLILHVVRPCRIGGLWPDHVFGVRGNGSRGGATLSARAAAGGGKAQHSPWIHSAIDAAEAG